MKHLIIKICYLLFSALIIAGCKEKEEDKTAPSIPPSSTFILSTQDYSDTSNTLQKSFKAEVSDSNTDTYENWLNAISNITFWNLVVTVHAIVPVAAFKTSLEQQAEYLGNNKWEWSFSFYANGTNHEAMLTAKLSEQQVSWNMNIDDFTWYTGISQYDQSSGNWTLYKNPNTPYPFIKITWSRYEDGTADIKYLNITPDGYTENTNNGGYITYGTTSNTTYDAYYEIYNAKDDKLINIQWNTANKNGKIKNNYYFDDDLWHCWDSQLADTTCY